MSTSRPPAPGSVVDGRYELVAPIEDRGLGESWHARDTRHHGRAVAVKLLRPLAPGAPLPDALARLFKALRALRHPSVPATVNHGLWDGRPYLVQDLFRGASLGTGLDAARQSGELVPVALLARFFDHVCAAVEAAHGAALPVVHGGLTPGSVIVHRLPGEDFELRVLDFGLAPWASVAPDAPARSARGLASPAPETYAGAAPAPATDVFGLGGLLREMLATPAPVGETLSPAGVHRRRDDAPDAVWAVIEQALRHDPATRFASVAALRAAAREALASPARVALAAPAAPAPSSGPSLLETIGPAGAAPPRVDAPARVRAWDLAARTPDDAPAPTDEGPAARDRREALAAPKDDPLGMLEGTLLDPGPSRAPHPPAPDDDAGATLFRPVPARPAPAHDAEDLNATIRADRRPGGAPPPAPVSLAFPSDQLATLPIGAARPRAPDARAPMAAPSPATPHASSAPVALPVPSLDRAAAARRRNVALLGAGMVAALGLVVALVWVVYSVGRGG